MDELVESPPPPVAGPVERSARQLLRAGAGYAVAVAVANAFTAVFQFSVARLLAPGDYSLLATLLAVIMVIGVPLAAIQASVARSVAAELARGATVGAGLVVRESAGAVLRAAPALFVLGIVAGVPLAIVLNVHAWVSLAGTAVTLACSFALPVVWGAVQGMSRFRLLGGVQVGYSLLKLALGVLLAWLGAGVGGVMLGIAGASVAVVAVTGAAVLPLARAAEHAKRRARPLLTPYNASAAVAFAAFAFMTTADVIVARFSFPHAVAGAYSAAAIGSRVLLLVAAPVTTILLPRVAALSDLRRERRHLLAGAATVALVAAPVVAVFWLFPATVLGLTFGHAYDAATAWLGTLGLAMTLYAIASVFQFHFLSLGRTSYVRIAAPAALLQIALYARFHAAPHDLVRVQLLTSALLVAASETYERILLRRSTQAA